MPEQDQFLTLTPLGGYGEIGMNCTLWTTPQTTVLVDCGLMFPDDYHLGVDVVIPPLEHILAIKENISGIVLTHGHEDHIGALIWLMPWLRAPIYGSRFTLALVENRLREANLLDRTELIPVDPDTPLTLGDLTFHFFPVCHSIIEGYGLGVETPVGKVVHTGDFKIERDPIHGHHTDIDSFRRFSSDGVKLMLSDSTNVEREGWSITEREIMDAFDEIFAVATGRVVITLFSSHIQRIQEVFDFARKYGRKVAVSGRSLVSNIETARDLGFLNVPSGVYLDPFDMPDYPDEEVILLVTGSQGEPLSALARIVRGEHKSLAIKSGDTVIMSSRFIPGNVRAITKLINQMYRLGAEVYYDKVKAIHASGHAYKEELRTMFEAVKPEHFVPVHGEYRHLVMHCRLAHECGIPQENTHILEDGDPITILPDAVQREEHIHIESLLVDGKGVGDVGQSVLKERHILGGEGMVVVFLVLDDMVWEILHGPDIVSKGFIFEAHYSHVLEDAKCIVLDILENIGPKDIEKLQDRIRSSLRRFFRKVLERDPVVIPVITMV